MKKRINSFIRHQYYKKPVNFDFFLKALLNDPFRNGFALKYFIVFEEIYFSYGFVHLTKSEKLLIDFECIELFKALLFVMPDVAILN